MSAKWIAAWLTTFALALASQSPQTQWDWLDGSRQAAFDRLMPLDTGQSLAVAYRSYRDLYYAVNERYFRIETPDGASRRLVGTVVAPVGKSIQEQLLELHARIPNDSVESLVPRISVRRAVISDVACRRQRC